MDQYILVIGASAGVVSLLSYCKELDHKIIVVSIEGDYPGFAYADKVYYIDVYEKEKIYDAVKHENIIAVVSDQLDMVVPTVAYVAEKLNLKTIGYECSMKFRDKFLMLNEAKKFNINIPKYYITSTFSEAKEKAELIGYPIIIKPNDSQASAGVRKVSSPSDLESEFHNTLSFSREKKVLIQEYIPAKEYCVNSFSYDYKCNNLVVGIVEHFTSLDSFVPKNRLFKSIHKADELDERVLAMHKKIVESFGLSYGSAHGEYLYNSENDTFYLCEIAARGGGFMLSSDLIPIACGVEMAKVLLHASLNEFDDSMLKTHNSYSAYTTFILPNGTITKIEGIEKLDEIKEIKVYYLNNLEVGKIACNAEAKQRRYGPIIFEAEDYDHAQRVIKKIQEVIRIEVENEKGELLEIIWD